MTLHRRLALCATALATAVTAAGMLPSAATTTSTPDDLRDVMFVGNNWAGTASIVDARDPKILKSGINLIPDKSQEMRDINLNPLRLVTFLAVRIGPGQGHDQFVDDMCSTRAGRFLAVSRPSFGDVVWIDIAKAVAGQSDSIVAEQPMDGYRSDHAGLSPDGTRLLVSDSVERQVIEFAMVDQTLPDGRSVKMGDRLRTFESGDTPHENNYTPDGTRIFPAIDVDASSTRREELLMSREELSIVWKLRRVIGGLDNLQGLEMLLDQLRKTQSNAEFLMAITKSVPA